jgi:hypothetical protein
VGLGLHVSELDTVSVAKGNAVSFTFYWPNAGHWEGTNFTISVGPK